VFLFPDLQRSPSKMSYCNCSASGGNKQAHCVSNPGCGNAESWFRCDGLKCNSDRHRGRERTAVLAEFVPHRMTNSKCSPSLFACTFSPVPYRIVDVKHALFAVLHHSHPCFIPDAVCRPAESKVSPAESFGDSLLRTSTDALADFILTSQ
jgi:hypothetical protein